MECPDSLLFGSWVNRSLVAFVFFGAEQAEAVANGSAQVAAGEKTTPVQVVGLPSGPVLIAAGCIEQASSSLIESERPSECPIRGGPQRVHFGHRHFCQDL